MDRNWKCCHMKNGTFEAFLQGSIVIAFPYFSSQLTFPGDNQTQQKNGMKCSVKDQEIFYD